MAGTLRWRRAAIRRALEMKPRVIAFPSACVRGSASLVSKPFHRPGWVYEEKYDGYRILAYIEGAKVTLRSRNDHDRTATFAGVARAVGRLQDRSVLLNGEVVAFDSKGVSRFQPLQRGDVAQSFAVFDCLYRKSRDLRSEPLRTALASAARVGSRD